MGRENKKEAVASLHREMIMKAAEALFSERSFEQTTIEDISKASGYSRRTVYAYFESKDDILHHIVEKGLISLKSDIEKAVQLDDNFLSKYRAVCMAVKKYQTECPHSLNNVNKAKAANFESDNIPDTVKHILALGTEINELLADFIEKGKEDGVVRQDVVPAMSVYILWSGICSLIELTQTKGDFICKQFSVSESDFLEYGFQQIINSILK